MDSIPPSYWNDAYNWISRVEVYVHGMKDEALSARVGRVKSMIENKGDLSETIIVVRDLAWSLHRDARTNGRPHVWAIKALSRLEGDSCLSLKCTSLRST